MAARVAGGQARCEEADLFNERLEPAAGGRVGIATALHQADCQPVNVVLPQLDEVLPWHVLDLLNAQRDLLVFPYRERHHLPGLLSAVLRWPDQHISSGGR